MSRHENKRSTPDRALDRISPNRGSRRSPIGKCSSSEKNSAHNKDLSQRKRGPSLDKEVALLEHGPIIIDPAELKAIKVDIHRNISPGQQPLPPLQLDIGDPEQLTLYRKKVDSSTLSYYYKEYDPFTYMDLNVYNPYTFIPTEDYYDFYYTYPPEEYMDFSNTDNNYYICEGSRPLFANIPVNTGYSTENEELRRVWTDSSKHPSSEIASSSRDKSPVRRDNADKNISKYRSGSLSPDRRVSNRNSKHAASSSTSSSKIISSKQLVCSKHSNKVNNFSLSCTCSECQSLQSSKNETTSKRERRHSSSSRRASPNSYSNQLKRNSPARAVGFLKNKSPLRKDVSPKRNSSPLRKNISTHHSRSPRRHTISPRRTSPSKRNSSPRQRSPRRMSMRENSPRRLSPLKRSDSSRVSQSGRLSPKRRSPSRRVSPSKEKSPSRRRSPSKRSSPSRRSSPPRRNSPPRRSSPSRHSSPSRRNSPLQRSPLRRSSPSRRNSTSRRNSPSRRSPRHYSPTRHSPRQYSPTRRHSPSSGHYERDREYERERKRERDERERYRSHREHERRVYHHSSSERSRAGSPSYQRSHSPHRAPPPEHVIIRRTVPVGPVPISHGYEAYYDMGIPPEAMGIWVPRLPPAIYPRGFRPPPPRFGPRMPPFVQPVRFPPPGYIPHPRIPNASSGIRPRPGYM